MTKYWREHDTLSINKPSRIVIKGHTFIEHQSSVKRRKRCFRDHRAEPVMEFAYWNGAVLTEPQILEHLSVLQKAG